MIGRLLLSVICSLVFLPANAASYSVQLIVESEQDQQLFEQLASSQAVHAVRFRPERQFVYYGEFVELSQARDELARLESVFGADLRARRPLLVRLFENRHGQTRVRLAEVPDISDWIEPELPSSPLPPVIAEGDTAIYAIQLASFRDDIGRRQFVERNMNQALYCRTNSKGFYVAYWHHFSTYQKANNYLTEHSEFAANKPLVVKLKNVRLDPCLQPS